MRFFAIADPHLSFNEEGVMQKPMSVFGPIWDDHWQKLKTNWMELVEDDDCVIVAGDISWGLKLEEAKVDLDHLRELPGTKLFFKGNHDLWWLSQKSLDMLYATEGEDGSMIPDPKMRFIKNDAYIADNVAICGTRGWVCPGSDEFTEHDMKIYLREAGRLERSLQAGRDSGAETIIGVLHYPPTNDMHQPSLFTRLMERYGVKTCVYGHLHKQENFKRGIKGVLNGVEYRLVSYDYVEGRPVRII